MKRLTLSALFVFVTAFSLDASPHWANTVDHIGTYVAKAPANKQAKKESTKKRSKKRSTAKKGDSRAVAASQQPEQDKPTEQTSNRSAQPTTATEPPSVSRWKAWTAAALTAVGALSLGTIGLRQFRRLSWGKRFLDAIGDIGRLVKLLARSRWSSWASKLAAPRQTAEDDVIPLATRRQPPLYAIHLQAQIPHIVNEFAKLFSTGDVYALRRRTTTNFMQAWEPALVAATHLLQSEFVPGQQSQPSAHQRPLLPSRCVSATDGALDCHLDTQVLPIPSQPTDPKSVRVRITGWGKRGKEHVQIFDEVWHFTENLHGGQGSPRWLLNDVDPLTTSADAG